MISIKNLSRSFSDPSGQCKEILRSVSFNIPTSSFTTIFGPNGCGKSTLINILVGLDVNYSGVIDGLSNSYG